MDSSRKADPTKDNKLLHYLKNGFEQIMKDIFKASLFNPKESLFMGSFLVAGKKAAELREGAKKDGIHIPPFLIASITEECNLHCAGCYARANGSCSDHASDNEMSLSDWKRIFTQAREIGISFILLAGGEPLLRRDVVEAAAAYPEILFPLFTNGTKIDDACIGLLDKNRNIIPILSLEGNEVETDARRGVGTYRFITDRMAQLKKKGILFGASVTVTKENLKTVTTTDYIKNLQKTGCKAVFFIEYVPVSPETVNLAPTEVENRYLEQILEKLRPIFQDMVLLSFPGDEKEAGGCLAAGRGFFHINCRGGVEPCPFSPYSDTDIRSTTLKDALNSSLFLKLREAGLLQTTHTGGCVLFEQREAVEKLTHK